MLTKEHRLNVLLDLDNTIINSIDNQEISLLTTNQENQFEYKDMSNLYRVFARPHLETFLDYLFEHYNVGVFTAAESSYALFIVNNFILTKPGRKLDLFMYRYHVSIGQNRYGSDQIKDLRLLWDFFKLYNYYPCNTVLIDDLSDVKQTNPLNVIAIPSFDILSSDNTFNTNAKKDTELLKVIDLLDQLRFRFSPSCIYSKLKYQPILADINFKKLI